MLDRAGMDVPVGVAGGLDIRRLSADTLALVWDVPTRLWTSPQLEAVEGKLPAPLVTLRLPLNTGGTRLVWALRAPRKKGLRIRALAGALSSAAEVAIEPDAQFAALEPEGLLHDLTTSSRLSLAMRLIQGWPGLFGLNRSRTYVGLLHQVVGMLAETPTPVRPVARINDGRVIVQTVLPAPFGKIDDTFLVTPDSLHKLPVAPHVGRADGQGRRMLHAMIDRRALNGDGFVVVIGGGGMAIRRMAPSGHVPSLPAWWRQWAGGDPGLYQHIVATLAGGSDSDARAAVEFQLRCPLPPQRVAGGDGLPAAEITLALSVPSGVLVGGWYHDPSGLVEGIDLIDGDGAPQALDTRLHRFRTRVEQHGETVPVTGFVASGEAGSKPAPLLQPRFLLRLASGARYVMVPPRQPADPGEARAVALRAVPPQHVSEAMLDQCLAPALGDLQNAFRAGLGAETVKTIGEPVEAPSISIIVPLYRVLDFLRVQVAAFAADPDIARHAEIVFVVDSPEQTDEIEHLLRGLNLLYGLPVTMVVMSRNSGYALACNAGAAAARGGVLAFLNSDVLPAEPGWLSTLVARLGVDDGVAAVGPKLLFEDGSIQHAGMYFSRDPRGHWLNHHFHKGMPRRFAPACVARTVPAVTGACLVLPQPVFESVGGFCDDYVIGDYEDSDLCLKIRDAGYEIAYCPEVELYHLERQSIRHNADYMRGTAWRYNSWLHASRWDDAMTALMSGGDRAAAARRRRAA